MTETNRLPWGAISTAVAGDRMTSAEAIKKADLDWEVETRSVFVGLPDNKRAKIDGRKAVVRKDTQEVLGLVSDRYKPFQNTEAFEFIDSILETGEASISSVGLSRGSRDLFITAKLPEQILIAGEDAHDMYVVVRTSHDGSRALTAMVTPIRVACTNMMRAALKDARSSWRITHSSTLKGKVMEARESLALTVDYTKSFAELGERLVATPATIDTLDDLLTAVLPDNKHKEETIQSIEALYESSQVNGYQGTRWGVLNAVTEYFDHHHTVQSADARFRQNFDGRIAKIRNQAIERLVMA